MRIIKLFSRQYVCNKYKLTMGGFFRKFDQNVNTSNISLPTHFKPIIIIHNINNFLGSIILYATINRIHKNTIIYLQMNKTNNFIKFRQHFFPLINWLCSFYQNIFYFSFDYLILMKCVQLQTVIIHRSGIVMVKGHYL